jgi:gluconolactonase
MMRNHPCADGTAGAPAEVFHHPRPSYLVLALIGCGQGRGTAMPGGPPGDAAVTLRDGAAAERPGVVPPANAAGSDAHLSPPPDRSAAPLCPPGPFDPPRAGERKPICAGFQVNYDWNEGPTWVAAEKAFFFSNFVQGAPGPGDMIRYDPATDRCEVFIAGNGCNGLTPDRDGSLLAACHTPRALLRYDLRTRRSTVVVDMVEGQMIDAPNDVVVHRNGTIYFSNTTLELGARPEGLGPALLRVDPAGLVHIVARGGINPLALSPDGRRLYAMGGYWDLDDAGSPIGRGGSFTLGSDGLAVDCGGNVYTQGGAIISPENQPIGRFPGGTNMAFGGLDGKTMLVVAGRAMYTVQMNLPGLP